MDEKYQKRVITYVKKIANGYKNAVKNIIIQQEGKEYFQNWDFTIEFEIPESNEDVYRVKNSKLQYAQSLLELLNSLEEAKEQGKDYSLDALGDLIQEDLRKYIIQKDDDKTNDIGE